VVEREETKVRPVPLFSQIKDNFWKVISPRRKIQDWDEQELTIVTNVIFRFARFAPEGLIVVDSSR
jgi:hypothetical protein